MLFSALSLNALPQYNLQVSLPPSVQVFPPPHCLSFLYSCPFLIFHQNRDTLTVTAQLISITPVTERQQVTSSRQELTHMRRSSAARSVVSQRPDCILELSFYIQQVSRCWRSARPQEPGCCYLCLCTRPYFKIAFLTDKKTDCMLMTEWKKKKNLTFIVQIAAHIFPSFLLFIEPRWFEMPGDWKCPYWALASGRDGCGRTTEQSERSLYWAVCSREYYYTARAQMKWL